MRRHRDERIPSDHFIMEKKPLRSRKPPKPLKILVNLFARSKRAQGEGAKSMPLLTKSMECNLDNNRSPPIIRTNYGGSAFGMDSVSTHEGYPELYTEMEALHLSRMDNPFVQKKIYLSHEDLLDSVSSNNRSGHFFGSQSVFSNHSLMSPDHQRAMSIISCSSPTNCNDPQELEAIHNRLVRSPPPVTWPEKTMPVSPRSNGGAFSPDSTCSNEIVDTCNICSHGNYYMRSQSEERILSRENLDSCVPLSPSRGATPDILMTTSMPNGSKIVRRNQSCEDPTSRRLGRHLSQQDYKSTPTRYSLSNGHSSSKLFSCHNKSAKSFFRDNHFFSSWRPRRRETSSTAYQDAKSMENLQVDLGNLRSLPGSMCSPSARKSMSSVGCLNSPRNCATLFTKIKEPQPQFV